MSDTVVHGLFDWNSSRYIICLCGEEFLTGGSGAIELFREHIELMDEGP